MVRLQANNDAFEHHEMDMDIISLAMNKAASGVDLAMVKVLAERIPESVHFRTTALKPLRSSTTTNKLEIMRYLLIMAEQTDDGQLPCLDYCRSLDAIRVLIENGVFPDPPNQDGDTLEALRRMEKYLTEELRPTIEYLLERIDVESKILAGEADKLHSSFYIRSLWFLEPHSKHNGDIL